MLGLTEMTVRGMPFVLSSTDILEMEPSSCNPLRALNAPMLNGRRGEILIILRALVCREAKGIGG